jgi:glutamate carboxypeptidase
MKGGPGGDARRLAPFEASPRLGRRLRRAGQLRRGDRLAVFGPLIAELARGKAAALTYEPRPFPTAPWRRARGSGNFSAVVAGRSAHAGPQSGMGPQTQWSPPPTSR